MEIDNSQNILDSRDIGHRIEELTEEREALIEQWRNVAEFPDTTTEPEFTLVEWDEGDSGDELKALKSFNEDGEQNISDWTQGETLIRDSYFRDYAEELADDIGRIDRNASWPLNHIDWDAAADELKQDYTSLDFDGVTYWARS